MSGPALFATIIVLVVPPRQSADPSTVATAHAIEDGSDPGSIVVIRERSADALTDDALARAAEIDRADGAAVVTVQDERRTSIRIYVVASRAFASREVVFQSGEPNLERARATGFLIASVMGGTREPAEPADSAPVVASPPLVNRSSPPPEPPQPRFGAEVLAMAHAGVGGPAGAVGGELAGRLRLAPRIHLRGGAGFGFGTLEDGTFTTTTLRLRGGVSYGLYLANGFDLGARLELLAIRHTAALGGEGAEHWVGAGAAAIEGSAHLSRAVSLVAAAGPEVAFGTVRVVVADETRVRIPWVRLGAGIGGRFDF